MDTRSGARARTRQQNSGNNKPVVQENKYEEVSVEEMRNRTCIDTEEQHRAGWSEGACHHAFRPLATFLSHTVQLAR